MAQARTKPTKDDKSDTSKREQVLNQALQHITKVYGNGAVMRLDSNQVAQVDGISTSSPVSYTHLRAHET